VPDAFGYPVGHARCNHPAVAVPDQDEIAQLLELDHRQNVLDVHFQVNGGGHMVCPLP
jgi:hypothetical protein